VGCRQVLSRLKEFANKRELRNAVLRISYGPNRKLQLSEWRQTDETNERQSLTEMVYVTVRTQEGLIKREENFPVVVWEYKYNMTAKSFCK
jgi:hypothetical protein